MLQNATSLRETARTSWHLWWTCLLYWACHAKCIFPHPLQMPHTCHRFWKCYKILTFCSLLTRCTIPCWTRQFLHFWLRNVLRATMVFTFSTSQLPKVVPTWGVIGVMYILTSKCASRYNGVQLFISHLARWLRTRFSERAYFSNLRGHKSLEKHSVSRLCYLFAHLHLLSSDSFSSLIFSPCSSLLWLFPLSICPYCRKFDF